MGGVSNPFRVVKLRPGLRSGFNLTARLVLVN